VLVKLHPEARAELRSAAIWYDGRRAGLGDDLVEAVNEAIGRIGTSLRRYPRWPSAPALSPVIRRIKVERFPYSLAFQEFEDHVLVLAVPHNRRRPLYWLERT
jgi:hypothetical protein